MSVATAQSISSLLNSINGRRFGIQDIVKRYRTGIPNLRPILPKQMTILDPNIVLNYLNQPDDEISLKLLLETLVIAQQAFSCSKLTIETLENKV